MMPGFPVIGGSLSNADGFFSGVDMKAFYMDSVFFAAKKVVFACLLAFVFLLHAQESPVQSVLADGLNAYRARDYVSAVFFLRKALTDPSACNDGVLYTYIMSEMQTGDYTSVYADTEKFLSRYASSPYSDVVLFQQGKALFNLREYDRAVVVFSDYCHRNPDDALYPSALFYLAECFYAGYDYERALPVYRKVAAEYPDNSNVQACLHRVESIMQKKREDKLLYLLKKCGEDYLASKENYEKIIRQYEMENSVDINQQLKNLRARTAELEASLENERSRVAELERQLEKYESADAEADERFRKELERLNASAGELQNFLDGGE